MEAEATGNVDAGRTYVVFLGKTKLTYQEQTVAASRILEDGGATPAGDFVLEALRGEGGKADRQFQPSEGVDLSEQHRVHFRAVPDGGGRA